MEMHIWSISGGWLIFEYLLLPIFSTVDFPDDLCKYIAMIIDPFYYLTRF